MRLMKWMALCLALCLLAQTVVVAEELEIASEYVEEEIAPADSTGGENGLWMEDAVETEALESEIAPTEEDGEDYMVEAAASDMYYARVTAQGAKVFYDVLADDAVALLAKGETVLVTGGGSELLPVAYNAGGSVLEGYMSASELEALDADAVSAALDAAASVALYAGDLDWPLIPLGEESVTDAGEVMASSNYKDLGNDTVFTINGKEVYANMFPDTGSGNCWRWAQSLYQALWGCRFSENFAGKAATGMNLLRNLGDEERLLTPDHLKNFVMSTQPGATIRICGCTSECSSFENDGLACGHTGHSLVIVAKSGDGVTTMDSHSNSQHTRFYSWQGFCNAWKNYPYIKYIKWPNAPALAPGETLDGVAVRAYEAVYRVRAGSAGVKVLSAPKGGTALATLTYPATFSATKKSTASINGSTWLYGSGNGVTGWLALTDDIADVNGAIPVTSVTLSQNQLSLGVGASATLTAAVAPADATNKALVWSSSDASVATVKEGAVTGVGEGSATITARSADGAASATCAVTVAIPLSQKALTKTGSNGTVKLAPGQQLQLVAQFATSRGWKLKSATSSNTSRVTIDRNGVITAKSVGKATITVTTKNRKKAKLTVKVEDPSVPSKIVLSKKGTVRLKKGKTLKLYTAVSPITATTTLVWKSSKPKVAAVDREGNVIALKKGTCYIGVMTDNGKFAKVRIKVR